MRFGGSSRSRSWPFWRSGSGAGAAANGAGTAKPTGTPIVIGAVIDLTKNMAPFDAPALAGGADRDRQDQRGRGASSGIRCSSSS